MRVSSTSSSLLITVIASAIILVIQWFSGNGMIIGWLAD